MKKATKRRLVKAVSYVLGLTLSLSVGTFIEIPDTSLAVSASSDSINEKKDKIKDLELQNRQIDNAIAALGSDISHSKEKQELLWQKLVVTQNQLDAYNNMLYDMEQDIAAKQAGIEALDIRIADKETDIKLKEKEIEELSSENEKNLENFGKVIHAMYVAENTDLFSVLAESSDFYDLLVRTKMMINVSKQNKDMMNTLKQSMAEIEKKKRQLETDKADLESSRQRAVADKEALEADKAALEEKRREAGRLTEKFTEMYNKYSLEIADFEQKQEQLESEKQANAAEIAAYQEQIDREIKAAQEGSSLEYQQGEWLWPLEAQFHMITTYFGLDYLYGQPRNHKGIDVSGGGIYGHPIYASKAGTVIIAKTTYIEGYSYGKYVVIDHGDGYSTLYGHCSDVYVSVGQQVERGEAIGAVGSTGNSTGPHLHFEVRENNVPQDPFNYVKKFW